MNHFDREERQIHAALSKIEVDSERLAERVKRRFDEPPLTYAPRRRKGGSLLAAALAILFVSAAALTIGLGRDALSPVEPEPLTPNVIETPDPLINYAEDQGIRITVTGTERLDDRTIFYLSVQDVSGENRLTAQTSFMDGFRIWTMDGASLSHSSQRSLRYFDESTNTAYFEFHIWADVPLPDRLKIGTSLVFFYTHSFFYEPMEFSLAGLPELETISLAQDYYMWTGLSLTQADPESLQITRPVRTQTPMPHGDPRQWISNMGIVDGQFRVQYGGCYVTRNEGLGPGDATFALISPSGESIYPIWGVSFVLDGNLDLIPSHHHERHVLPTYRFEEHSFDLDLDLLPYYTLAYTGHGALGISGDWRIWVELPETETPAPEETPPDESVRADVLTARNVQVSERTHEDAAQTEIVISTDLPLQNFHFVAMEFGLEGDRDFMWATSLYALEELTAEEPFVVTWMDHSTLPERGIVFLDEDYGGDRFFYITRSSYDGALLLVESKSGMFRSPRTQVTGLLEDPNRSWESISVTAWMELESGWWLREDDVETHILAPEDASRVIGLLGTMDATEVLTPFYQEGQRTNSVFTIEITFADGGTQHIHTTDRGDVFFRFTDTFGSHGDAGYVIGINEALSEILSAYFANQWRTVRAGGWDDSIIMRIPPAWQSYDHDTGDPNSHLRISGEGADGRLIELIVYRSPLALSTLYESLDRYHPDREHFQFNDGLVGYMLEAHETVRWYHIEEGRGIRGIILPHDGDRRIFTDNEELILRIVRSLR